MTHLPVYIHTKMERLQCRSCISWVSVFTAVSSQLQRSLFPTENFASRWKAQSPETAWHRLVSLPDPGSPSHLVGLPPSLTSDQSPSQLISCKPSPPTSVCNVLPNPTSCYLSALHLFNCPLAWISGFTSFDNIDQILPRSDSRSVNIYSAPLGTCLSGCILKLTWINATLQRLTYLQCYLLSSIRKHCFL